MIKMIPKQVWILLAICLGLFLLIFITVLLTPTPQSTQNQQVPTSTFTPSGNNLKQPSQLTIQPTTATILTPGETPTFLITFPSNVNLNQVQLSLTKQPFNSNQPSKEDILTEISGNTLNVKLVSPIQPSSNYVFTITGEGGEKLKQFSFVSNTPALPRQVENNLELVQYLPYQAENYDLVYIPNTNTYVFSFNFNPSLNNSVESQYNNARQDALEFIRSKNIDPNSLKIEWRYH